MRFQAARIAGSLRKSTYRVRSYHLHVLKGECDSFEDIEQHERVLENEKDEEIKQLLEDMAQTICNYEQERDTYLTDITNMRNKGKTIKELTPRHAFTDYMKHAPWFAESFGLVLEYVHLRKAVSGSPVKVTSSFS